MRVTLKTERQIEKMRTAGRLLAYVHRQLHRALRPGMSTLDIDRLGEELIRSCGCVPNFKNYEGYPASICVSVNDEVVHGIPAPDRILREGDIVSLDAGLIYKGYHSDAARTWGIGRISEEDARLIRAARECFFAGISKAKEGAWLCEISGGVEDCARKYGFGIVRELAGHGIGSSLHEDPEILNYRTGRPGIRLKAGMTLAVEPMITSGKPDISVLEDDWTIVTDDGSNAAHYENTILITPDGCEVLSI